MKGTAHGNKKLFGTKIIKACTNFEDGEIGVLVCHCSSTFYQIRVLECKNIFTKIEVPKSIETRSKCSMHAGKGRG